MSPFQLLASSSSHRRPWNLPATGGKHARTAVYAVLLGFWLLFVIAPASATNYYMSPTGNDSNPGTTQGAPLKTFAHAIPKLNPGDTLNLMDGTYTTAANGNISANCSGTAHNGTSGSPVTIQAQNERQAYLQGNGGTDTILISNCSYWRLIGLHVSSADLNSGASDAGMVANFINSPNCTIRRNVMERNNRYHNTHVLLLYAGSSNCLIEENEIYYFHRVGIILYGGANNNEVRRNYANSRGYTNIAGGYPNGGTEYGMVSYASNGNIFENNISENVGGCGFNNEDTASSNTFIGNISARNASCGFRMGPHTGGAQPTGNVWTNNVAISNPVIGFWNRGGKGTYDHNSAFGTSTTLADFQSDLDSGVSYSNYAFIINDSLAQNGSAGFKVVNVSGNDFSFGNISTFNTAVNFSPSSNVTNAFTSNPGLGSCYLWIPDSSQLKGAGSGGGDVGANIVFRYEGGASTGQPLWDPTTGAPLYKGATVAGVNDVAGSSLFDIANRLNINKNGCALPTTGGTNVASAPSAPTGLTATVQ